MMILNLVPSSAFITCGYCAEVLKPVAPTATSTRCASATVFTGEVCQVTSVLFSKIGVPIQVNLRVSKVMPASPTACSSGMDWSAVASTVPSLGATL